MKAAGRMTPSHRAERVGSTLVAALALLAACSTPQAAPRQAVGPVSPGAVATEAGDPAATAGPTETPTLTPAPTTVPTATPGPGLAELLQTPQAQYTGADLEGAAQSYEQLATLYPHRAEPWIGQAAVAQRTGDVEAALAYLEEAVAADPGSFEAWHQLGVLYEQREDYEQAARVYGAMLQIAPADPDLYLARAMALARLGDGQAAAQDLMQAQSLDPNREYAWLNVAGAAYGSRAYETTIEVLSAGIGAYPAAAGLRVLRGQAYMATGNAEAALADFDAAVQADDGNLSAHYWRGMALDALGRAEEAVASFDRAGELGVAPGAGGLTAGFEAMAQAARVMARTDANAAYAYLQEKAITHGQPPPILFGYALIEYERGNRSAALDTLNRLIDLSSYLPAYYWRGKINAELGNTAPARDDLRAYLNGQPAGPQSEDAYGILASIGG